MLSHLLFMADTHLLKLQSLQNRIFRVLSDLGRSKLIRELNMVVKVPYIYNYIGRKHVELI